MTSLFIPLKRCYFEQFKSGQKDTEFRVHGKRWNMRTCAIGRPVTLSLGYGKHDRLDGVIVDVWLDSGPIRPAGWVDCYGSDPALVPICIKMGIIYFSPLTSGKGVKYYRPQVETKQESEYVTQSHRRYGRSSSTSSAGITNSSAPSGRHERRLGGVYLQEF